MRVLVLCLLLVGCGEAVGPEVPPPSRLEYCGYDETPCEEPAPPPSEEYHAPGTCWVVSWSAGGITYIRIYCN